MNIKVLLTSCFLISSEYAQPVQEAVTGTGRGVVGRLGKTVNAGRFATGTVMCHRGS